MADLIEPTHYDAVVISSGLPEVLIASALARAGKAVLVLDPADTYGSSWASLSGADFVNQLISASLSGEHLQELEQQQHAQPDAKTPPAMEHDGSSILVQQLQQLAGVQDCSLYTHPSLEQALDNKGIIIDLAPRVLYQDEPLVQLLVSCQAHNYLEFKLVEGNYVYLDGRLQPVPASRADLFADRALSLADKRSLGRFMAACVEAAEGSGRLKDAFDSRPLIDLLTAEGLNERLQQLVLYGIAMADVPQHAHHPPQQQQQQQQEEEEKHKQEAKRLSQEQQQPATAAGPLQQQQFHQPQQQPQPQPHQQQKQHTSHSSSQLSAAEGLSAFVLYSRSLGRYGGSGALMAPCYGCGSLTEAFVRLAAVKGAVTALRQPARQLQLLPDAAVDAAPDQLAAAPAGSDAAGQQQQQQLSSTTGTEDKPAAAEAGEAAAVAVDAAVQEAEGAAPAPAVGPIATAPARLRLTLASGQTITAGHVVSSSSSGRPCDSSSSSGSSVARAVALLDSSLVEGDTSLLFVIPLGTLGPWQQFVIRGLQLGHALAVAPPGHCLLYLAAVLPPAAHDTAQQSMPSSQTAGTEAVGAGEGAVGTGAADAGAGCSIFSMQSAAEQMLAPALAAVAATQHLQGFALPAAADMDNPASSSGEQQQQQQGQDDQQQQQQQQEEDGASPGRLKPRVLAACFYTMQQQQQQGGQQEAALPQGSNSSFFVQCQSAPAAGFAGYSSSIDAAETLYRQHFADLPWLTDPLTQQQSAAAAEGTGGSQAGSVAAGQAAAAAAAAAAEAMMDDEELDAIDELTAALMELSTGLETMPGQGSASAAQV